MSLSQSRITIQKITFGAILTSIAIILKILLLHDSPDIRVALFEIPIMISGILLGPLYGAFVGFSTDVVYIVIRSGMNVGLNLFTLEAVLYGLLPGTIFYFLKYSVRKQAIVTIFVIIINFTINTTQLYLFFGIVKVISFLPYRVIIYTLKLPIQIYLIHLLLTHKSFYQFGPYKLFEQKHKLNANQRL